MSIILAIVGFVGSGEKTSEESVATNSNVTFSTSTQLYCVPESYAKDEKSKNHNPFIEFIEGKPHIIYWMNEVVYCLGKVPVLPSHFRGIRPQASG